MRNHRYCYGHPAVISLDTLNPSLNSSCKALTMVTEKFYVLLSKDDIVHTLQDRLPDRNKQSCTSPYSTIWWRPAIWICRILEYPLTIRCTNFCYFLISNFEAKILCLQCKSNHRLTTSVDFWRCTCHTWFCLSMCEVLYQWRKKCYYIVY